MAVQTLCNCCGKVIEEDSYVYFSLHTRAGYGSAFDGDSINLDLCAECADETIRSLSKTCKVPIVEEYKWEF